MVMIFSLISLLLLGRKVDTLGVPSHLQRLRAVQIMTPSSMFVPSRLPFHLFSSTRLSSRDREDHQGDDAILYNATESRSTSMSKRNMLGFALPALGIYLSNPLLSNIDNAFVGRTVGTQGLAALSPATICTDQMLYLFSFLGRATTGMVARANTWDGDTTAARKAAAAPLTVALTCGVLVSIFYAFCTPALLAALQVNPSLRPMAASYIYWRGAIAWAALAQSVCLSVCLATRDAITPLKIIGLGALVNIIADTLLCAWQPFGCAGAAAATALATLVSAGCMVRALRRKHLWPTVTAVPSRRELKELLHFAGPLSAITVARLSGFIAMQKTAMRLGVQSLAGYQLGINLLMFFLLFGEPLSQISQTQLPQLLDRNETVKVRQCLKSAWTLAAFTAAGVAGVAFLASFWGCGCFTADLQVQAINKATSPALFVAVATAIFTVAVDGAMLASREFGFMLLFGTGTLLVQLGLLPYCQSVSHILGTFTFRLGSYALVAIARIFLGYGEIGRVLKRPTGKAS